MTQRGSVTAANKRGSYAQLHLNRESLAASLASSRGAPGNYNARRSRASLSSLSSEADAAATSPPPAVTITSPQPVATTSLPQPGAAFSSLPQQALATSLRQAAPEASPNLPRFRAREGAKPTASSFREAWQEPASRLPESSEARQLLPQAPASPTKAEVLEFLEGLLEGFRMAGVGYRADAAPELGQADAGSWQDLAAIEKVQPRAERAPGMVKESEAKLEDELSAATTSAPSESSLSTLMRRQALKAFLEETCSTVANSFDIMAGLAIKARLGGSGNPQDRLRYMFGEQEFRLALMGLGYGVGGKDAWWKALFVAMDVDGDGSVSIQDMYDALVLALPPMHESEEAEPGVFFTSPSEETWRRKSASQ